MKRTKMFEAQIQEEILLEGRQKMDGNERDSMAIDGNERRERGGEGMTAKYKKKTSKWKQTNDDHRSGHIRVRAQVNH